MPFPCGALEFELARTADSEVLGDPTASCGRFYALPSPAARLF